MGQGDDVILVCLCPRLCYSSEGDLPGPELQDVLLHCLCKISVELTYKLDGGRTLSMPSPLLQLTAAAGTLRLMPFTRSPTSSLPYAHFLLAVVPS
jgi:hypothetical protein